MNRLSLVALLSVVSSLASACAASPETSTPEESELVASSNDHWFYDGPLPALQNPTITISLAGNTARVSGDLPSGVMLNLAELPHVRLSDLGGRKHVDVVYPIASARPGKSNSSPGAGYGMSTGKLFRPDGIAVTKQEGEHMVAWGGFPFLPYNRGIALHGPISAVQPGVDGVAEADAVWHLLRGRVSGGCNRMMGEHVVELAHLVGFDMGTVHARDKFYNTPRVVPVTVLSASTYDTFGGKSVDVDYPTGVGITRPKGNVEMFGSWVATGYADGSDLPMDEAWEGGVRGTKYSFAAHSRKGWVCSLPMRQLAGKTGMRAPKGFCSAPSASALK